MANSILAAIKTAVEGTLTIKPFVAILETGITQIIGVDDTEVSISGDYSSTADLALGGTYSGEILSFQLTSLETGSGAIQGGDGYVFFFDADPNTTSGDTALAAAGAEHNTIIGAIKIEAADWNEDASGGVVHKTVAIPFHALSTIYCVYRNTDGTAVWNSDAADNERLNINMWFRRDS